MPALRLVVAEDDTAIRELIVHHCVREGFRCTETADGPSTLRAARAGTDVLILDVGLAVVDGFDVLRTLRREGSDVPVVMVTARSDEVDRVIGLELGADDYVTKPFSPRELIARVRAVARRGGIAADSAPVLLRFDRLEVDEAAREARVDGVDVALKPREFALLLQLAGNPGVAFSRTTLLQEVWGYDFEGDERTVDVHVRRLRAKLEEEARLPRLVQTVHGFGYKLPVGDAAPVLELDARLAAFGCDGVPLLVFRLPALERTAWRNGLRAARAIERRAGDAFAAAAARILRPEDLIAHDRGTDAFVAALLAPTRDGHRSPAPVDVRSAAARIAATVEGVTALDVDAGWTRYDVRSARGIDAAIARALVRGAQERERYAFFSVVGHELRTPLASIRGYLETLLDDDADRATQRRFVEIAHGESLRLTRLLEGMFEISLLDLSATFPHVAGGALDVALAGAADASAARAAERRIELSVAVLPPTPVAIDGDRLMLVLINLIDNAIKHGRRGGRVEVSANIDSPRTALICVDDDGPGIPVVERDRVFALGSRGPTHAEGTGIGLALVRMILERAGARVDVCASPLGGARFTVTVPRRSPSEARKSRRRGVI